MTSGVRTRSERRRACRTLLLVMAVVAAVLAMHALSPSGTPSAGEHVMMAAPGATGHHATPLPADDCTCPRLFDSGHGGTGMHHADGTCAAGGTAVSYVPPALLPSPAVLSDGAPPVAGHTVARTVNDRAPPDLSELQLLRI